MSDKIKYGQQVNVRLPEETLDQLSKQKNRSETVRLALDKFFGKSSPQVTLEQCYELLEKIYERLTRNG